MPPQFARQFNQAARCHRGGMLNEAAALYQQLLAAQPDHPELLRLLAVVRLQQGQAEIARSLLTKALGLAPNSVPCRLNLASALKALGEFDAAIETIIQARQSMPDNESILYNLANTYRANAQLTEASLIYRDVLQLNDGHLGAWINLGHVNKALGESDEAAICFRKALDLHPGHGDTYWALANIKSQPFTDEEVSRIRQLLNDSSTAEKERIQLQFALGKALEDRGQFDDSFAAFEAGNSAKHQSFGKALVDWSDAATAMIEAFDVDRLKPVVDVGADSDAPIFIVSLPRSGSTLAEQILASHSLVTGAAELPDMGRVIEQESTRQAPDRFPLWVGRLGPEDWAAMGKAYLAGTERWRATTPRFTDKALGNFERLGTIALSLPGARFIHCIRDPMDTCLSCYQQLFATGHEYSYSLETLASHYAYYRRLMQHWQELFPERIHNLEYERLVESPETEIRRLLEFCDLSWEDACLTFHATKREIRTASAGQVTQPMYSSSIGRWRRYEKQLQPLLERLVQNGQLDTGHADHSMACGSTDTNRT